MKNLSNKHSENLAIIDKIFVLSNCFGIFPVLSKNHLEILCRNVETRRKAINSPELQKFSSTNKMEDWIDNIFLLFIFLFTFIFCKFYIKTNIFNSILCALAISIFTFKMLTNLTIMIIKKFNILNFKTNLKIQKKEKWITNCLAIQNDIYYKTRHDKNNFDIYDANFKIGFEYESKIGNILEKIGYSVFYLGFSKKTDRGIDIFAISNFNALAIQCKFNSSSNPIKQDVYDKFYQSILALNTNIMVTPILIINGKSSIKNHQKIKTFENIKNETNLIDKLKKDGIVF